MKNLRKGGGGGGGGGQRMQSLPTFSNILDSIYRLLELINISEIQCGTCLNHNYMAVLVIHQRCLLGIACI